MCKRYSVRRIFQIFDKNSAILWVSFLIPFNGDCINIRKSYCILVAFSQLQIAEIRMECATSTSRRSEAAIIFALFIYGQVVLYFLFDSSKFSISLGSSFRGVSIHISCVAPVCNLQDKASKLIYSKIEADYKYLASFAFDRETGGKFKSQMYRERLLNCFIGLEYGYLTINQLKLKHPGEEFTRRDQSLGTCLRKCFEDQVAESCPKTSNWFECTILQLFSDLACLNGSKAGGDLGLIQFTLFLLCKSSCSYANMRSAERLLTKQNTLCKL